MLHKIKSNLTAVIGSGTKYPSRSTGELELALGLSPALLDKKATIISKSDFPSQKRWRQQCQDCNILEYGKSGQPPKPFLNQPDLPAENPALK